MSLKWSTYNTLFRSEKYGRFCYNALSNTLIELDEPHYILLDKYTSGIMSSDIMENGFYDLLRQKHMLVEKGEEDNLLLVRQHNRQSSCFETSTLGLTICPTLRCNFRCDYCFEASRKNGFFMSVETQERLIDWIKAYKNIRTLSVASYGGEPLLAFDTICALSERFKALGLTYEKVSLITNGYLLNSEKISRLNDLMIDSIQITLDGPSGVHDTRRVLAGGGPTFARILENVTTLMDSNWAGECRIRVNVDKRNRESYIALRTELLARFKGKKLIVYPGHVDMMGDQAYDGEGCLNTNEWAGFNLDLARRHGIIPAGRLISGGNLEGACVAGNSQSFVLGPGGELYKCWKDVGRQSMVVGNIHTLDTIIHPILQAQYATGVDPYSDPECRTCTVLPICGGGCAHRRLLVKYHGRKGIHYCSPYKTRLQDYLEGYIDMIQTRDMCAALLQKKSITNDQIGYRVISSVALQNPRLSNAVEE